MKLDIFEKALWYYESGMVHLEEETPKIMYFEVDGEDVTFSYGKGFLETSCTDKHCSIKSVYNTLCSRKLACIFYLKTQTWKKTIKREKKKEGGKD